MTAALKMLIMNDYTAQNEVIELEDKLCSARKIILDYESQLIRRDKLLTDIINEIKVTCIGAVDYGTDQENISRNHWKRLEAFGKDAQRILDGEL